MEIKDTTMLFIQIGCIAFGVLLICLGVFVFMNKAQVQYAFPFAFTGIIISLFSTVGLSLFFDIKTGGSITCY